ncbi:hypothetical protein [Acinetobacter sp.]|uniref:DUF7446 family protein n=1 Tax=Acinetobacter sp. TaxID=472 RepID=UPI0028A20585|nr:hypothetical protein [Acinetobacter sp.]
MTNPMRVVCSMLTNQIYASRVDINKGIVVGKKEDVTDSAITAVAIHLQKTAMDILFDVDGKKYRMTVVEEPAND